MRTCLQNNGEIGRTPPLAYFKEQARNYVSDVPDQNDLLGWLSLMQHYGAPTRLTDWTVSPFVACYFAYEKLDASSDSVALWMLNAQGCRIPHGSPFIGRRDHTGTVSSETYEKGNLTHKEYPGRTFDVVEEENQLLREAIEKEISWPLPLLITNPDPRMLAQQACFVCSGSLTPSSQQTPLELLLDERNWDLLKEERTKMAAKGRWVLPGWGATHIVRKLRLPREWRVEALTALAKMNITARTLFPGLDGLGRSSEVYIQVGEPASLRDYLGL